MKRLIFLLLFSHSIIHLFAQEQHPYVYGITNGSLKLDVIGTGGAMVLEVREYDPTLILHYGITPDYYKRLKQVFDVPYEKTLDLTINTRTMQVWDLPAGMYTFNIKYAPQGNDTWRTAGSKAINAEVVSDSKYICLNHYENE